MNRRTTGSGERRGEGRVLPLSRRRGVRSLPIGFGSIGLSALADSDFLSAELPSKRMRRSREVTSRRRRDAGSKFRSPRPAMRRWLKCRVLSSSPEVSKSFSFSPPWQDLSGGGDGPAQHLLFKSCTKCYLNLPLEHVVKINAGTINHRKWIFFLPTPPRGLKIRGLNLMFISTERGGKRRGARWRRPQRAQKDPQNPEGRQAADRDERCAERGGGEEETHRRERGAQGETPRGKNPK